MKYWWSFILILLVGCDKQDTSDFDIKHAVSLVTQQSDLRFNVAYVDLNSDNSNDAIVLLQSMDWCGSGGCTMLIFENSKKGYQLISKSTVTNPPIRITNTKSHGWYDLIVWSKGKGDVLMSFNGHSYPTNPSLQPLASKQQQINANIVLE